MEVIKGGGTQQAKDAIQQALSARDNAAFLCHDSTDGSSCARTLTSAPTPSKSRRVSEHTMTVRRLQRFYHERGEGAAGSGATMSVTTGEAAAAPGTGDAGEAGRSGPTSPVNASHSASTPVGGGNETYRPQTCPVFMGGSSVERPSGVERRSTSRQSGRRKVGMRGEDVRGLLLRTMVGYDWVDEFNGQEMRVRGAFTEQDVGVLEVRAELGLWEGRPTAKIEKVVPIIIKILRDFYLSSARK